jgi:hypothetical protein
MASRSLQFGRRNLLCALTAGTVAIPLLAQKEMPAVEVPPEVAQALPQSQALGAGRLRYLLWDVFDATLWVVQNFRGVQYFDHAFALELRYLRKFSGASLVESSVQEMRRVGSLDPSKEAAWTATMQTAFADVQAGDRITGVHRPGVGAQFFFNGRLRGTVNDPTFARAFFGIWLGASTSEPRLRSALLAEGAP